MLKIEINRKKVIRDHEYFWVLGNRFYEQEKANQKNVFISVSDA